MKWLVAKKNGDEITESHNAKRKQQKIITAMLVTIQTKTENSNGNSNMDNNKKRQQKNKKYKNNEHQEFMWKVETREGKKNQMQMREIQYDLNCVSRVGMLIRESI